MKCEEVWRKSSSYLDGTLAASSRQRMNRHLDGCAHCKAVLDGTRNVVELVGDPRTFKIPADVSSRLYAKLDRHLESLDSERVEAIRKIPVGITSDQVEVGSHLIYFWESDEDFERGVRFLYPGLGQGEHCIVFGHDEALTKVMGVLRDKGFDPDQLVRQSELTVIRRHVSAQATLADIRLAVEAALRAGATAVRFLGNLGMGRNPLPAGEDDVLELECKATALISTMPCVIVCMYDVRTLSGRMILKGGLQSHHLAVCPEGVRENPYYESPDSPPRIQSIN